MRSHFINGRIRFLFARSRSCSAHDIGIDVRIVVLRTAARGARVPAQIQSRRRTGLEKYKL